MEPHQLWVPVVFIMALGSLFALALVLWFLDRMQYRERVLQLFELGEAGSTIDIHALLARPQSPAALKSEGIVLIGTALGFAGGSAVAVLMGLSSVLSALPLAMALVLAGAGGGKVVASGVRAGAGE